MTLPEFLLARIAQDEELARSCQTFERSGGLAPYTFKFQTEHILAECDAKRRIVDLADDLVDEGDNGPCDADRAREFRVAVWRALATPYADHPDYRQEWTP